MPGQDRRQYPRFIADLNAYCYQIDKNGASEHHLARVKGCVGEKEGEVIAAYRITDISKGGLFLMTIRKFPVDTILVIELLLPGKQGSVSTVGIVRWFRDVQGEAPYVHGMGVNFLYMKQEDWATVEKYLTQLKPFVL
ncbi:MAG TPA: PilZ domain-containing protein [bacterium]|nr:PilZ domain-containing protein [bacterium]